MTRLLRIFDPDRKDPDRKDPGLDLNLDPDIDPILFKKCLELGGDFCLDLDPFFAYLKIYDPNLALKDAQPQTNKYVI